MVAAAFAGKKEAIEVINIENKKINNVEKKLISLGILSKIYISAGKISKLNVVDTKDLISSM